MKDLKHLIYFEHLLDEAANELVMQAVSEGKHAVGYTCYHMPEVLLNLDNCFSVRMRAPRTGSLEISTYCAATPRRLSSAASRAATTSCRRLPAARRAPR